MGILREYYHFLRPAKMCTSPRAEWGLSITSLLQLIESGAGRRPISCADTAIMRTIRQSSEMPLIKQGNDGLRPVSVGCSLKRIALTALLRANTEFLRDAAGSEQFAVGRRAAIESMHRAARHAIDHSTDACVPAFDCTNAFGPTRRGHILNEGTDARYTSSTKTYWLVLAERNMELGA